MIEAGCQFVSARRSGRRQPQPAPGAFDQGQTECLLQLAHQLLHGCRSDVQFRRRLSKAQMSGSRLEGAQGIH